MPSNPRKKRKLRAGHVRKQTRAQARKRAPNKMGKTTPAAK